MEESTLRWLHDKEREEMEEVCSIGEVPHTEKSGYYIKREIWAFDCVFVHVQTVHGVELPNLATGETKFCRPSS